MKDIGDDHLAVNAPIGTPTGLAVDVLGNLFFTNGGDMVRRVAADTGIITRVAGAGGSYHSGDGGPAVLAQLHQPSKVALDSAGNIYIAARGEHRIRKIRADSDIITTIAGSSLVEGGPMGLVKYLGGFSGDGGPATEALSMTLRTSRSTRLAMSTFRMCSTIEFAESTQTPAL